MVGKSRITLFGVPMDAMTAEETCDVIDKALTERRFIQHVVVNVAKIVHMQSDEALFRSVASCDIINIDGMGVVWAAKMCGHRVPERVAGIDLFLRLLDLCKERGFSVFLLGATPEVLNGALLRISEQFAGLRIAGAHHGFFWDKEDAVVEQIRDSKADMLFVAISSPLKENFIARWGDRLGVSFVMGVGGTFDVISGKVARAPLWMQRCGLEWFYRMMQEPRRMAKRYLTTNMVFLGLIIRENWRRLFRSIGS